MKFSIHPSTGPLLPLMLHKASFALPDANIGQAHNTRLLSDRDVLVVLPDSDIVGVNILVDGIDEDIVSGPGLAREVVELWREQVWFGDLKI